MSNETSTYFCRYTGMRNTPALRSMKKLSQMSFDTEGVAVAVRHRTRSTSISSANRAILRYSGRKLAPHCAMPL